MWLKKAFRNSKSLGTATLMQMTKWPSFFLETVHCKATMQNCKESILITLTNKAFTKVLHKTMRWMQKSVSDLGHFLMLQLEGESINLIIHFLDNPGLWLKRRWQITTWTNRRNSTEICGFTGTVCDISSYQQNRKASRVDSGPDQRLGHDQPYLTSTIQRSIRDFIRSQAFSMMGIITLVCFSLYQHKHAPIPNMELLNCRNYIHLLHRQKRRIIFSAQQYQQIFESKSNLSKTMKPVHRLQEAQGKMKPKRNKNKTS